MNLFHFIRRKLFLLSCVGLFLFALTSPLHAADAAPVLKIDSGDNAWLLASSALVLMMTAPGLILFYGGLVRNKNVLATMMHSLVLMGLISALWMVFGYSLAFAEGKSFFGNPLTYLFLNGVGSAPNGDYAPTIQIGRAHV